MTTSFSGTRVLLVISGGIAAYKALDLIRRLRERGADVRCILTSGGAQFVTPLSVSALSGNKAHTDLFSLTDEAEMGHIRLARDCDLVIIAPASANLISRAAQGRADDLASTVLLATDKPLLFAPAMNPVMWQNTAVRDNVALLKKRGAHFVGPAAGDMACGETGEGRLAEVADIIAAAARFLAGDGPLKGRKALVTSGPTFEPIDPVRFIGNRSSGKQGHAIAHQLALAGADVTLVSGPVSEPDPPRVTTLHVETAAEMLAACQSALPADIAVCAAAVGDFRAEEIANQKIKKTSDTPMTLHLVHNPDILATLSAGNSRPCLVVGFAAETDGTLENAKKKLVAKGCDWILLNDVSGGKVFGAARNRITLLKKTADGEISAEDWPELDKKDIARDLAGLIGAHFAARP